MREPGVGRNGGLTEWHLMNVADMWACLQGHHPDSHWRHVAGWRKVAELAGQHLATLKSYRARLAQVWPPETNAASHAYLAKLDELIEQVLRTQAAASTNQTALSAATQALSSSRTEIQKLYDEYAAKLRQRRAWEETAADPKAAAASRSIQSPVTDSDLERLNIQARNIMYGLSAELQQAQTLLRHPPPTPRPKAVNDQTVVENYPAAPVIPPVMPLQVPSTATPSHVRAPSSKLAIQQNPHVGPVLGGIPATTPPSPKTPQGLPQTPSTSPEPLSPNTGQPITSGPRINQTAQPAPRDIEGLDKGAQSGKHGATPRPVEGVIGGNKSGTGQPHHNSEPRRVNPIGGIIGGGAAGTAPAGSAGSRPGIGKAAGVMHGSMPIGGSPQQHRFNEGRKPQGPRNDNERQWDPDMPWTTTEGVNPILRPPDEEGPIDPGPAIGLTR
ncbi:hypothetical protein FF096_04855 [Micromonospora sp. CP22]|nr:hypothetical protein [Micromonospora sp. CP22]